MAYNFKWSLNCHLIVFNVPNSFTEQCSREWNQDAATYQLKNSSPGTIGTVYELWPFFIIIQFILLLIFSLEKLLFIYFEHVISFHIKQESQALKVGMKAAFMIYILQLDYNSINHSMACLWTTLRSYHHLSELNLHGNEIIRPPLVNLGVAWSCKHCMWTASLPPTFTARVSWWCLQYL